MSNSNLEKKVKLYSDLGFATVVAIFLMWAYERLASTGQWEGTPSMVGLVAALAILSGTYLMLSGTEKREATTLQTVGLLLGAGVGILLAWEVWEVKGDLNLPLSLSDMDWIPSVLFDFFPSSPTPGQLLALMEIIGLGSALLFGGLGLSLGGRWERRFSSSS